MSTPKTTIEILSDNLKELGALAESASEPPITAKDLAEFNRNMAQVDWENVCPSGIGDAAKYLINLSQKQANAFVSATLDRLIKAAEERPARFGELVGTLKQWRETALDRVCASKLLHLVARQEVTA